MSRTRSSVSAVLMLAAACSTPAKETTANSTPATAAGGLSASAAPTDSTDRASLIVAREAVWRAYFTADSAALAQLLPEKMVHMGHHRDQIIRDAQEFKRGGGVYRGITFTDDEFYVRGEVAVVFSKFRVDITRGGKADGFSGQAIELFEKKDGRWINPSWHLDNDTK